MNEKYCQECGSKIPVEAKFCERCGAKQEPVFQPAPEQVVTPPVAEPVIEPVAQPVAEPVYNGPVCENTVPYEAAPVAPEVTPVYEEPAPVTPLTYAPPVENAPKKKSKWWIIVVAAVLVVAILGGSIAAALSVFASPKIKLLRAFNKTIKSGSFTYEVQNKMKTLVDDELIIVEGQIEGIVVLDFEEKELTANSTQTQKVEYDGDTKEGSATTLIYDGNKYFVNYANESGSYISKYDEDTVEGFFEFYEENGGIKILKPDWEAFYDLLKDLDLYDNFKDIFDKDDFEEAYKEAIKENIPEIEKDGNEYVIELNVADYLTDLLETFEDAFEDSKDYKDIVEGIEERYKKVDLELRVTLSGGYIEKLVFEISDDKGNLVSYDVKFADFGKCEINETDMEKFIDHCKKVSGDEVGDDDDDDNDFDFGTESESSSKKESSATTERVEGYPDEEDYYEEDDGYYY